MVCSKQAYSTGEIIATSANQIVPPKFRRPIKILYYIHPTPFHLAVLKGGLGPRLGTVMLVEGWEPQFTSCKGPRLLITGSESAVCVLQSRGDVGTGLFW